MSIDITLLQQITRQCGHMETIRLQPPANTEDIQRLIAECAKASMELCTECEKLMQAHMYDVEKIIKEGELGLRLATFALELLNNTPDDQLCPEHLALKQEAIRPKGANDGA